MRGMYRVSALLILHLLLVGTDTIGAAARSRGNMRGRGNIPPGIQKILDSQCPSTASTGATDSTGVTGTTGTTGTTGACTPCVSEQDILAREAIAIMNATMENTVDSVEIKAHTMAQAGILMGKAAMLVENAYTITNFDGPDYYYTGEVDDPTATPPVPHGFGVVINDYGYGPTVVNEGLWKNGVQHGLGLNRWGDGRIFYTGQWHEGKRHGLGVFRNWNRSVNHAGLWKEGQPV